MSKFTKWIVKKLDTLYYNNPQYNKRSNLTVRQNVHDWAHYVHKHHVILARAFEFADVWSREIMAYYHPFQHANIFKVAAAITSDRIQIINPEDLTKEEPTPKKILQNKWTRNQGQLLLRKAIEKGRKHGWLLYMPILKHLQPKYYTGPPWRLYSADEADAMEWDAYGHPIKWQINPSSKFVDSFELSIKDCYFFDVYHSDDFDGYPEGSAIWDLMIDWLFSEESMTGFGQRMANGFLILPVPLGTPEPTKSAYQEKIMNVRTEMGLIWEVGDGEDAMDQKPEWMTPQSGADFPAYMAKLEDGIATGMGFPKRYLMGDAEGAMESSGKDKLQVYSKLNAIFNQWKEFVKGVCLFHKWVSDHMEIEVRAGFKMETSEEEKVNIDLLKMQTIAGKTWLSVNEQREADGMEAVEEEGADEVMVQEDEEGGSGDQESSVKQTKPSDAKNDSFLMLSDALLKSDMNPREIAKVLGVSPTTIYKAQDSLKILMRPQGKLDALVIKEDSMQISDNVYEYDGIVLQSQKKYYDKYKSNCITPRSEIERIFNDKTYSKEFRIGVTGHDNHESNVPSEVLESNAIGTVKYEKLTDKGIYGKVRIDLNKTDKVLGNNNWIREHTALNKSIPMSVARWTVDKPHGDDRIETNIDIRSYVATRQPRNKEIGVQ